jgi:hypothetical protein
LGDRESSPELAFGFNVSTLCAILFSSLSNRYIDLGLIISKYSFGFSLAFSILLASNSDVVTRVRVRLKSGLESDFAGLGLGLGLRAERLGLGLGLEHVTWSPSLELPISLELVQRPLEKLN